ncbi:MAG TPA: hypothetical protein VEQ63_14270, partial [Bryobacteraceae bacterium]|nr:hypothetical protein [Bryobacteraceae bacterium]
ISYALIFYGLRGTKPMTLFQSIASGLLGRSAYKGGMQAATLGAILHFVIALGAAAVYYAASRKVAILTSRPVMSGMAFGAGVWLVMNLLVLPLSQFGPVRFQLDSVLWGLAAHMVLIGVPIALSVQRFARG